MTAAYRHLELWQHLASRRRLGTVVGIVLLLALLVGSPNSVLTGVPAGPSSSRSFDPGAGARPLVGAGLTLFPLSGGPGTVIRARGTGFAGSTPISFTFGGSSVNSTCSTDAGGGFPGSSGTACTFDDPDQAGGQHTVVASDGTTTASASFWGSNLTLSPDSGPIGSTIAATGVGLGGSSDLTFTFNSGATPGILPRTLASTCSANATGVFPGTTGTACTFTVPLALGGPTNVTAVGWADASSTVAVGSDPTQIAYDPAQGEFWVSDDGSSSVSVFSATNGSLVANVTVQSDPEGVAYDPVAGEMFVADQGTDNVTVINATNDTVLTNVAVGQSPIGVVYDSGMNEIFVANEQTNIYGDVSVLSPANNTVNATIDTGPFGTYPYAIAYDPASGQIFVTNWDGSSVTVLNDSNDSVVTTIQTGSAPWGAAYDPGTGDVYIVNEQSDNVSVINGTTDAVVATVKVGAIPYGATYDPLTGEVIVSDYYSQKLSIIADATNQLVASVPIGDYLWGVAFDPASGEVAVAGSGSDTVSLAYPANYGTTAFTVNASLSAPTATGTADIGQNVTILGNGYGPTEPITTFTLGSDSLTCLKATNGTCVAGTLTSAANGTFIAEFTVPPVATAGSYTLTADDAEQNDGQTTLIVNDDPTAAAPTAAPASVDIGQSTTLSVVAGLGSGGYQYVWTGLPTGCAGTLASIDCRPRATGAFSVMAKVTDSNGKSATSAPLPFTVYSDPLIGSPVASPVSGDVDGGQSVTFTAQASEGTLTYSTYTWSGLPTGCTGSESTVTCAGAELPPGQYMITVNVTDSDNETSLTTSALSFLVNPDPTVSTPVPSRASVDVDEAVSFSASASSGSGTYAYSWTGLPSVCTGVATAQPSCTPAVDGTFDIALDVTDSNGGSATSSTLTFVVYAAPTAALMANRTSFDVNQPVSLAAQAGAGSGGYAYTWTGLPPDCTGTTATIVCSPVEPGSFPVRVKVNDSNGGSALSTIVTLTVAAPLAAALSAAPNSSAIGEAVVFTANETGGTGPFTYAWQFGDGSTGNGGTADHTYRAAGNYTVTLWVYDSSGGAAEKTLTVLIVGPPAAPSAAPSAPPYLLIAAVLVVVAVVAGAAFWWFRGRSPPVPEDEGSSPGSAADDGPTDFSLGSTPSANEEL